MKRRDVLGLLVGSVAFTREALAQPIRRVVLFTIQSETNPAGAASLEALRSSLRDLGWIEGQTIDIEPVWAGTDVSRYAGLAADLARRPPDVVVSVSSAVLRVLKTVLPNVPIVFVAVSNPDGQGFVASISRPGGNITGFTHLEYSIGPKWVQLLKEVAPSVSRVLVLFNPDSIPAHEWLPPIQSRGRLLGAEVIAGPARDAATLDKTVADFAQVPGGGLLIMPDAFTSQNRDRLIRLATTLRLPAIYPWNFFAKAGGLISYGSSLPDLFRRAGAYADRILKGAKPADLPVQQPTKFEMAINLKTAKALGLTIPPTLLVRADEMIE